MGFSIVRSPHTFGHLDYIKRTGLKEPMKIAQSFWIINLSLIDCIQLLNVHKKSFLAGIFTAAVKWGKV